MEKNLTEAIKTATKTVKNETKRFQEDISVVTQRKAQYSNKLVKIKTRITRIEETSKSRSKI